MRSPVPPTWPEPLCIGPLFPSGNDFAWRPAFTTASYRRPQYPRPRARCGIGLSRWCWPQAEVHSPSAGVMSAIVPGCRWGRGTLDEISQSLVTPGIGAIHHAARNAIAQQYAAPFDAIFDSPQARRVGRGRTDSPCDRPANPAPLVAGAACPTLPDFDYRECALASGRRFFLYVHAPPKPKARTALPASEYRIGRLL